MQPVAVVGNLSLDLLDGAPPRVGGAAFYCGRALAALDAPALVVTACALEHKDVLVGPLESMGLEVGWVEAPTTSTFGMRYRGDVREMWVEAIGPVWTPADVERLEPRLAEAGWVHVGGLLRSDFPAETLAALARGRRLSLDAQGLVRMPGLGPLQMDADFDPAVLPHLSVLKVSEEEAVALVGAATPEALDALGVPEIVLTLGTRGAIVIAGGAAEHVPAEPPVVPDPTGTGDMFAAAYMVARADGSDPVEAARRAAGLVARLLVA